MWLQLLSHNIYLSTFRLPPWALQLYLLLRVPEALTVMGVSVPVVVRLEGNNAEVGLKTLDECDLNIIPASSLEEAADLAVKASKGEL